MTEVILSNDALTARIHPLGACLMGLRWRDGDVPLILEFLDRSDPALEASYAGVIAGPVANRLEMPVTIDGQAYRTGPDTIALHGGPAGLSFQRWQVAARSDAAVTLTVQRAHLSDRLPGTRTFMARYVLHGASLTVQISATTDHPTLIAPAHHPYWTLGTDGVQDLALSVCADSYLPTAPTLLPSGTPRALHTPFDLADGIPPDLDHNYCLATAQRAQPAKAATLSAANGLSLTIDTTEPGLQVYAGAHLPDLPLSRTFGTRCNPGAGIALEPQFWPNAPAHPHFAQPLITSCDTYSQTTRYTLQA